MSRISEVLKIVGTKSDPIQLESYIIKHLASIQGVTYTISSTGDIFATKGTAQHYPTYICHTADFFDMDGDSKMARLPKNIWVAYKERPNGIEQTRFGPSKVSVHICLKLLQTLKEVKCVFYKRQFDKTREIDFFADSRWVIEPTKLNENAIYPKIMSKRIAGETFTSELLKIGKKFEFIEKHATSSICEELRSQGLQVSCMPVTNGVWNNYGANEQLSEGDMVATIELCKRAARDLDEIYWYRPKALPAPAATPFKSGNICSGAGCLRTLTNIEKIYCCACITKLRAVPKFCPYCGHMLHKEHEFYNVQCSDCKVKGIPTVSRTAH